MFFPELYDKSILNVYYMQTHFGHSLVRDETCCETAQKSSNLQGTHVWATYEEEHSDSQETTRNNELLKLSSQNISQLLSTQLYSTQLLYPPFHTHECRLALVLNEKQLAPVGAGRLHPEHHQVGQRQQPQVGWQQELGQGAFITGGPWTGSRQKAEYYLLI